MVDRERLPPLPMYVCGRCGWSRVGFKLGYTTRHGEQRFDDFPVAQRCQRCDGPMVLMHPPRERVMADVASAIRSASLTSRDLRDLADAVEAASPETSPRELAQQVPQAAPVITAAARFSTAEWLAILAIVVSLTIAVMQTAQDDQPPVAPASQTVHVHRTSELSDDDVTKIATQVERDLQRRRDTPDQERGRERGDDDPDHLRSP